MPTPSSSIIFVKPMLFVTFGWREPFKLLATVLLLLLQLPEMVVVVLLLLVVLQLWLEDTG